MAAPPQAVKVAGVTLTHVIEASLAVGRSTDALNQPQGATQPPCLTIVRDASQGAELVGFTKVTNGDGKDVLIEAEVTVPKNGRAAAYVIKVKGHVAHWYLAASGDDGEPDREVVEIYAGTTSVNAGGASKQLVISGYKIK